MQLSESIRLVREPFLPHGSLPMAWANVYDKVKSASFFLSPEWTSTWVETYGAAFDGEWLFWCRDSTPVAAALLLARPAKFGPFQLRLGVLNTSCEVGTDGVYIEYNDILCQEEVRSAVRESLTQVVRSYGWDQLVISGYLQDSLAAATAESLKPCQAFSKIVPSFFVDLNVARQVGARSLLSRNTRSQIQRTSRLYGMRGPVALTVAQSLEEAQTFLHEMATLHQAAWQKRGELGAFASERFTGFHRTLIGRAWAKGKIHLAKITAGSDCVGILYSFYDRKKVYFYQSGFNYEPDNRLKPGLLCHALMIEWYTKYGADEYDFLAGDARYKRSLATDSRNLVWSTIDRDNAKMKSLRWLSKCKERVKRARSPATE